MNFHTYQEIMHKVDEHYELASKHCSKDNIVGIFYYGAANYGVDTEQSDVDTKLIVTPTVEDIALNYGKNPSSTTLVVNKDNEHIDVKDVRLLINGFKKQSVHYLETLFTPYYYVNPKYKGLWDTLLSRREEIAHFDTVRCLKAMYGMAIQKYNNLDHWTENKQDVFDRYGYDPKELHHLVRLAELAKRYSDGEPFADCLISKQPGFLKDLKTKPLDLNDAIVLAEVKMEYLTKLMTEKADEKNETSYELQEFLATVQCEFIKNSLIEELLTNEKNCV